MLIRSLSRAPSVAAVAILLSTAHPASASPSAASRGGDTLGAVLADAAPLMKLLVACLLLAAMTALVLAVVNDARIRRKKPPIGAGLVAGLRLGGPLLA